MGTSSSYSFNIELWNPQVSTIATTGFMTGSWKDGGHLQAGMSFRQPRRSNRSKIGSLYRYSKWRCLFIWI